MDIRERRDDDLEELVAVVARVQLVDKYPMFVPDGGLARFLTRPVPVAAWVAVAQDRIVGHIALNDTTTLPVMHLVVGRQPSPPAVYVARLLVDPAERRKGVGQRLLEHARRAAVDSGRSAFLDVVDTPTAAAAICLYRCCGWDEIGRVRVDLVGNEVDELVFAADCRTALARPRATIESVEAVVERDLVAGFDLPPGDDLDPVTHRARLT